MDAVKDLFPDLIRSLTILQQIQTAYDEEMWEINSPVFYKLRHIALHLSTTVGKVAKVVETADHLAYRNGPTPDHTPDQADLSPLIADLLIYSVQMANLVEGRLGEMLRDRYRTNSQRFAPQSEFSAL